MEPKQATMLSLALKLLSKGATYAFLLLLANLFLPEDYGKAMFFISIYFIVNLVSFIGLPVMLVPWITNKKDNSSVFYFLLIITLIFTSLGFILSLQYPWILPLFIVLPILYLCHIGQAFLRAKYKFHIITIFESIFVISIVFGLIFFKDFGKLGIILSYSIGYLVFSIGIIYFSRKGIGNIMKKVRINFLVVKKYLQKASVIALMSISFLFLNWSDTVILGIVGKGSVFEMIAKYNIAGPLSNIITLIPLSIGLFLLTRTAELGVSKKLRKYSLPVLHRTLRISFSFSLITAIILNSLVFVFVKWFFPKYAGIEIFVMILSIGIMFFSFYNMIYVYLTGEMKPEKAFMAIVIAVCVNIVLDLFLIPTFGLYGITIATFIAHLVGFSYIAVKMNLFKKYFVVYLFALFLPIAYIMNYFGLLLLVVVVPLLFYSEMIEKGDVGVVWGAVRRFVKN